MLYVRQLVGSAQADSGIQVGDVLVAADGEVVTRYRDLERHGQKPELEVTVLRNGEMLDLSVSSHVLPSHGSERLLRWAGAYLQKPHRAIAVQRGVEAEGIYVAYTMPGSPALRDNLYRNRFIRAVNGVEVNDLDAFLAEVDKVPSDEPVRLTVEALSGHRQLVGVRRDREFFPPYELRREADGWRRSVVE